MVGKVSDSSKFWLDWSNETIYYSIYWNKDNASFLIENQLDFLTSYSLLTIKYGICITPTNTLIFNEIKDNISKIIELSDSKFNEDWIPIELLQLYKSDNYLESSYLFYGSADDIKKETIVNAELKLTVSDILNTKTLDLTYLKGNYANPVNVEFFQDHISVKLSSNSLFPILTGQKTGWETRYIDNLDLAYLNGTRFNSFLRDLKKLCFQYGAERINYDEDYLYYLEDKPVKVNTEKGILFNGDILYYEDIYEILPENHKYKKFEELNIEYDVCGLFRKDEKLTLNDREKIEWSLIDLKSNPNEKHHFTLKIENAPKNVFTITQIESEDDDMFTIGDWVFVLFAGYSRPDIKMIEELIEVSSKYKKLNFAFKPFMDDRKIQSFTKVPILRKVTPLLLYKKSDRITFLSSSIIGKEKIEEILSKI